MHGRDHLPGGSDPIPALASQYTPDPAYGRYRFNGATLASAASQNMTFAYVSGTALLDLTDATKPRVAARGVYTVSCQITSTTGWTNGYYCQAVLTANTGTSPATVIHSDNNYGLGDATDFLRLFGVSVTCQMDTATPDYYVLQMTNGDLTSRTLASGAVYVQRLFTF